MKLDRKIELGELISEIINTDGYKALKEAFGEEREDLRVRLETEKDDVQYLQGQIFQAKQFLNLAENYVALYQKWRNENDNNKTRG